MNKKVSAAKATIANNPFVGLFCSTNNKVTLVPPGVSPKERQTVQDVLGTEAVEAVFYDSSLLGVFLRGNDNCFLAPEGFDSKSVQALKEKGIRIVEVQVRDNALGNLVACNNNGAMVSQGLKDSVPFIEKALGVSVATGTVSSLETVGAGVACTDKGFVCSPLATELEFKAIEKALKAKGGSSTANYGDPFVANSVVVNNNGVLMGENTTSHEILRILDFFQ